MDLSPNYSKESIIIDNTFALFEESCIIEDQASYITNEIFETYIFRKENCT